VICGQSVLDDACEISRDGGGRDDLYRLSCESAMWTSRRCGRSHPLSGWCPALQPIRRPELRAAGRLCLFGGTRPENVNGHRPNHQGAGPTNVEARVRFTCAWFVT
jgi:hypothetical protein